MNQVAKSSSRKALSSGKSNEEVLSSAALKNRIQIIQRAMKDVMLKDVHFGTVPGTPKPSLWKAGAEVLGTMFRIAPSFEIDNISDEDHYEFLVRCIGKGQIDGQILGEGLGSASSNEAKYKWRAALCLEEFEAIDADRRRIKFQTVWENGRKTDRVEQVMQIRAEPADIVNTVLKMAAKRAQVAMIINVLACSDIFAQDLEDLPHGVADDQNGRGGKPDTRAPRSNGGGGKPMSEGQVRLVNGRLKNKGVSVEALLAEFKLQKLEDLPMGDVNKALAWIDAGGKPSESQASAGAAAATEEPKKASESQVKLLTARMTAGKVDARTLCEHFKIAAVVDMPADQVNAAIDWINANAA